MRERKCPWKKTKFNAIEWYRKKSWRKKLTDMKFLGEADHQGWRLKNWRQLWVYKTEFSSPVISHGHPLNTKAKIRLIPRKKKNVYKRSYDPTEICCHKQPLKWTVSIISSFPNTHTHYSWANSQPYSNIRNNKEKKEHDKFLKLKKQA